MLYIPPISDYRSFYIQFATGNALDVLTTFSVVVKTHDYPMAYKVKEPYKNQWKDENGDDEYIGTNGLYIEAFTFKLECAMFAKGVSMDTAIADLNEGIRAFRAVLSNGFFKTYDSWTGFGFKDVRLSEFPDPGQDAYDVVDGMARVIFNVSLKVNDPVTHMVKSGNNIVDASTL